MPSDRPPDDRYLIWSNEHCGWWRPGRGGYCKRLGDAGLYSRDSAIAIAADALLGSKRMPNEIPVRYADLEAMKNRALPHRPTFLE